MLDQVERLIYFLQHKEELSVELILDILISEKINFEYPAHLESEYQAFQQRSSQMMH